MENSFVLGCIKGSRIARGCRRGGGGGGGGGFGLILLKMHLLCMGAAKTLVSLGICTGSP